MALNRLRRTVLARSSRRSARSQTSVADRSASLQRTGDAMPDSPTRRKCGYGTEAEASIGVS
jgi:hypothetical protein